MKNSVDGDSFDGYILLIISISIAIFMSTLTAQL